MADFDRFERLLRDGVVSSDEEVPRIATAIAELAASNQVRLVKGRSHAEIEEYLIRARAALAALLGVDSRTLTSSDNNADGKDLREPKSGREIELKSGSAKTDANCGLTTIQWAFDDDSKSIATAMRSELGKRRAWAAEVPPNVSAILASKARSMDALHAAFSFRVSTGSAAPPRLAHFVRCVSHGLTKLPEIRDSFERGHRGSLPLLLQANWASGFVVYSHAFLDTEEIVVDTVERTAERAQVVLLGSESGVRARVYPNFKNSFKSKHSGTRIPAEYWVSTPCFQVWVQPGGS